MCGFAGFQHFSNQPTQWDSAFLDNANLMLRHRGPDGSGKWQKNGQGLAHRRLAIIDLSPKASQPMIHSSNRYTISYNGEIYNFAQIRSELINLGHSFNSNSDTEVILNGFAQWGPKVFARLEGMFALAICDNIENTTFLARDKFGEKPLFYAKTPNSYLFGSAIKPILAWPEIEIVPNLHAIHNYLTLQYSLAPETAFVGIVQVLPAHWVQIRSSGQISINKYWQANHNIRSRRASIAELNDEFLFRLESAVRLRMISDVPLGAFLSGGVDSSAVVAMMARNSGTRIKTFSIGFDDLQYDERKFASTVSNHIGTQHTELNLTKDSVSIIEDLMWHLEEPFADPSIIPTYFVSKLAKEQVTVSLSGDGGDELFMGYGRYQAMLQIEANRIFGKKTKQFAQFIHKSISSNLARIRPFGGIRRRLRSVFDNEATKYEPAIMAFLSDDKTDSYGPVLQPLLASPTTEIMQRWFDEMPDIVTGAAWCDLHTYLPGDILKKVDNASMAVSLETRAPMLDSQFVEFALSLSRVQKLPNGLLKGFMKNALSKVLPHEILYRPKMGFGMPVNEWLSSSLKPLMLDTLLGGNLAKRGLFRREYLERIVNEHLSGYRHHHTRIWTLIMLELWFREWIDKPITKISI